jgi:hypothetical protein
MDEGSEETAKIGDKTVGWGSGENGPFVVVYHGDKLVHKSNPITKWGARREYERLVNAIEHEGQEVER